MKIFESMLNADGRRAWALIFLVGGGMAMTIYAAFAMYMVRNEASYVLYLGLAAHVVIFVVMTAFAGLLVRRNLTAKVLGNEFSVTDNADPVAQVVAAAATGAAAGAAQATQNAANKENTDVRTEG